jgi:hypothetical protein
MLLYHADRRTGLGPERRIFLDGEDGKEEVKRGKVGSGAERIVRRQTGNE